MTNAKGLEQLYHPPLQLQRTSPLVPNSPLHITGPGKTLGAGDRASSAPAERPTLGRRTASIAPVKRT